MFPQKSSRQIIAGLRRQVPDHIRIRTTEAAEGDNLDAVMGKKSDQALVLIFGKRRRHDYALEPERPAAARDRRQNRRGGDRRDLFHQIEDLTIRARPFVRQKQFAGDHQEIQRLLRQLAHQTLKGELRAMKLVIGIFSDV